MSLFFMIMSVPFAALFYHPHVLDAQGRCIAEPGSYNALWCPANAPIAYQPGTRSYLFGHRRHRQ